jgi:hypothetical protein
LHKKYIYADLNGFDSDNMSRRLSRDVIDANPPIYNIIYEAWKGKERSEKEMKGMERKGEKNHGKVRQGNTRQGMVRQ